MKKKPANTNDVFTGTQVGALIEGFRNDIKVVAEGLTSLTKKVDMMYEELLQRGEDLRGIKADLKIVKADLAEIIGSHDERIVKLETAR